MFLYNYVLKSVNGFESLKLVVGFVPKVNQIPDKSVFPFSTLNPVNITNVYKRL